MSEIKSINESISSDLDPVKNLDPFRPKEQMTQNELSDFIANEFEKARAYAEKSRYHKLSSEAFDRNEYDINLDYMPGDKVTDSVGRFEGSTWEQLSEEEKTAAVNDLVKALGSELDIRDIPYVFYVDREDGYCGSFAYGVNTLVINRKGFSDPKELVDTIAHEMRHAYQYYRAEQSETHEDKIYSYNFENYISPESDKNGNYINYDSYYSQYVEVEARVFANRVTDAMR